MPPPLPPPLLGAAEIQSIKDVEHLRLLSYAYYAVGGFTALVSSLFLFHVFFGLAILAGVMPMDAPHHRPPHHSARPAFDAPPIPPPADEGPKPAPTAKPFSPYDPPPAPADRPPPPHDDGRELEEIIFPRFMGFFMLVAGGLAVLIGWTIGGLTVYAGRCLRDRKHRVFTMVMAGLNCLHLPFGTLLGVFTFVVLGRPTVIAMYNPTASPGPVPPRV